jgi:SAM-dependent methyltransferase
MLLLSITNHLTQNVAPVPLLWVLPLALYLLTFAMAFNRRSLYSHWLFLRLLAVALGSMGYTMSSPRFVQNLQVSVPLFCLGLFICCMFCHGELYRLKPPPDELTSYYFFIALGGALGAVLVGLVAPRLFPNFYEFPVTLLLTAFLALAVLRRDGLLVRIFWLAAAAAVAVVVAINVRDRREGAIYMTRNFYAALTVIEKPGEEPAARLLHNGTVDHGEQFLSPDLHMEPTTYYSRTSGVGIALENCCDGPKRVGVIGLGAGTLAAYGKPGDVFRFYEINPQVVQVAQTWFTFLRDTQAKTDIVLGDARLSLEREPSQQFDVLAVDAFSGDAIPVHLLTREAILLYLRHLKPDGVLAIHTSNTFLDLSPVAKQLANSVGYSAVLLTNYDDDPNRVFNADWVLITKNQDFLELEAVSTPSEPIVVPKRLRLWTDDYNSLFPILKPVIWRNAD